MRSKAIVPALFMLLFMFGCGGDTARPVKPEFTSVSFTAEITYYNENYSADCIIDGGGTFVAMMTAPENLIGLTLEYSAGGASLKYNGLEIGNAERFLPENASVGMIREILLEARDLPVKKTDKNYLIEGKSGNSAYYLKIAPTGLPVSLKIPDCGLNVLFKNVSIIKGR